MSLVLYVGSRRYSSWSLRPFIALSQTGAEFETRLIQLDTPTMKSEIAKVNPAGKVPVLHHDGNVVWDSLAICEYVNELYPDAKLWPADRAARSHARSISAEMHSGFVALRQNMSMDLGASRAGEGHTPEALADVKRIEAIWHEALATSGGPFLFGHPTIADAMYAPVVTRFRTYGVTLDKPCEAYRETVENLPAMKAWHAAAQSEPKTR